MLYCGLRRFGTNSNIPIDRPPWRKDNCFSDYCANNWHHPGTLPRNHINISRRTRWLLLQSRLLPTQFDFRRSCGIVRWFALCWQALAFRTSLFDVSVILQFLCSNRTNLGIPFSDVVSDSRISGIGFTPAISSCQKSDIKQTFKSSFLVFRSCSYFDSRRSDCRDTGF